jgi:hypothetical protein
LRVFFDSNIDVLVESIFPLCLKTTHYKTNHSSRFSNMAAADPQAPAPLLAPTVFQEGVDDAVPRKMYAESVSSLKGVLL